MAGTIRLHLYGGSGRPYAGFSPKASTAVVFTLRPGTTVDSRGRRPEYKFVVLSSSGITVQVAGTEKIRVRAQLSSAGGAITSTTVGACAVVTPVKDDLFVVTGGVDVDTWSAS